MGFAADDRDPLQQFLRLVPQVSTPRWSPGAHHETRVCVLKGACSHRFGMLTVKLNILEVPYPAHPMRLRWCNWCDVQETCLYLQDLTRQGLRIQAL